MFLRRNVGLARRARGITLRLQLFVSDVNSSLCFVRKRMKRRLAQGGTTFLHINAKRGLNSFKYKTYQCTG